MSDDDKFVPFAVPTPTVGRVSPIHKGNAAEMAQRKHATAKAAKGQKQARAIQRAKYIDEAAMAAELAAESRSLDTLSNEELAERGLKRMLKIVILGGELFTPTSLREATESAQALSQIAFKETQRRKAMARDDDEDAESVEKVAKEAIEAMKNRIKRARAEQAS